ncbi:MAG: putative lipid II flippase FtsW [Myxococcota bacterium]|nr:putative lipid II flippase FtsW [Myxococcota bacterium]
MQDTHDTTPQVMDVALENTVDATVPYDRWLLLLTLILMGFGVVMVYSASIVNAAMAGNLTVDHNDQSFFLTRQMIYCGLALFIMVVMINVPIRFLRRFAIPFFAISLIALGLVLFKPLAIEAKGATRWIGYGPLRFQPSEGIKFAWIIFLAAYFADRQDRLHRWRDSWLVPTLCLLAIVGLLAIQKDFGTTVICSGLLILMVFAAGARIRHLVTAGIAGLGALSVLVIMEPYRMRRLFSFLDPDADPLGDSYQIRQALISFGSGDWTGLGLGGSRQKLAYLPEAHTDFVFSILGEELGLIGVSVVVVLFALFVWRGFRVARRAYSSFGALLAFGITAEIGFQAMANMAVATALLPTKGLTLPFMSYGGSSMLVLGFAVGVLLNISKHPRLDTALDAPPSNPTMENEAAPREWALAGEQP